MSTAAATTPLEILVVDDDPALVGAISALLTAGDYKVHAAYNGIEAVEVFDSKKPALVLLDLAMPGRDGLNVIHEIRTRSATPIIVLTGEADEAAKVDALDAAKAEATATIPAKSSSPGYAPRCAAVVNRPMVPPATAPSLVLQVYASTSVDTRSTWARISSPSPRRSSTSWKPSPP